MSPWTFSAGSPRRQSAIVPRYWPVMLLLWTGTAALAGQQAADARIGGPAAAETLVTEMYVLKYRPATGAVAEVEGLLSAHGSVELLPRGNILFIRDSRGIVRRALARLRDYDQPLRRVRLEIQIVRAGGPPTPGMPGRPQLPAELARRLRELLRFETFILLGRTRLEMLEGEQASYQFGGDYRVEFELRALNSNGQLRLQDFVVSRGRTVDSKPLIHTNLNLMLERPMVLGLAQTEASEQALMVVLTTHLMDGAE
ncbi:MAG: hypothetical protein O7A98_01680 [Acidobacteria bacterium]|nr:hypothetical protein [Acidobacteriota bacterium]